MFDLILKTAGVAFVFAAPVLVYFFVLDRPDERKSLPRSSASRDARIGHNN